MLNLLDYDFNSFSEAVRAWQWSEYVGAAIALVPLLPIPLLAFFTVCYNCNDRSSDLSKGQASLASLRGSRKASRC